MPTRQFEMRSIPAQVECETFHPQRKQTLFDSERSFGTMNWALTSRMAVCYCSRLNGLLTTSDRVGAPGRRTRSSRVSGTLQLGRAGSIRGVDGRTHETSMLDPNQL